MDLNINAITSHLSCKMSHYSILNYTSLRFEYICMQEYATIIFIQKKNLLYRNFKWYAVSFKKVNCVCHLMHNFAAICCKILCIKLSWNWKNVCFNTYIEHQILEKVRFSPLEFYCIAFLIFYIFYSIDILNVIQYGFNYSLLWDGKTEFLIV